MNALFLRINLGSKAREVGSESFEWFSHWVPSQGSSWQGKRECFAGKASRLLATVLMHWEPGYESAWIIVTDLEPEHAQIAWYRLRTWIEGGFKDFKRGFWGWHHSKMERASCVERLWLAMSLAQLWCVSLGCQAEAQEAERVRLQEPGVLYQKRTSRGKSGPVLADNSLLVDSVVCCAAISSCWPCSFKASLSRWASCASTPGRRG